MTPPSLLLKDQTMFTARFISALLLFALLTGVGDVSAAPEQASSSSAPLVRDSASLVEAAKKGKARKKGSKPAVKITDADVRKSSGALTLPAGVVPAKSTQGPRPVALSETERLDEKRKGAEQARALVAKASLDVAALERELARLEDDYYAENDAAYRDDVLRKRFEQTKRHLDRSRQSLHDARENQMKFEPPPAPLADAPVEPNG
ncbi:MAG TPA: hypothetical protein VNM92_07430 [Thermoanaerobaculia bacterium]|nr:hypothetical protein [Thermoanaerobaculia bacterium]